MFEKETDWTFNWVSSPFKEVEKEGARLLMGVVCLDANKEKIRN